MNKHFKKEFDQLCKGADPVIFTDFVDAKSTAYLEVVDHVRLGEKVSGCLENWNYNPVSKIRMDLALSQTEISKGCGMDEWHDDMKRLLMRCGCDDMGVLFLLSDAQIAKASDRQKGDESHCWRALECRRAAHRTRRCPGLGRRCAGGSRSTGSSWRASRRLLARARHPVSSSRPSHTAPPWPGLTTLARRGGYGWICCFL